MEIDSVTGMTGSMVMINKCIKYCQGCELNGIRSRLRFYQINLHEAIRMCSNLSCTYMLSNFNAEDLTIQRNAYTYYEAKRKRKREKLPKFTNVCKSSSPSSLTSPVSVISVNDIINPDNTTHTIRNQSEVRPWEYPNIDGSEMSWAIPRQRTHIQLSQRFPGYHPNPLQALKSSPSLSSSSSSVGSPLSIISGTDREVEMIMSGNMMNSEKEGEAINTDLDELCRNNEDLRHENESFISSELDNLLSNVISEVNKVDMQGNYENNYGFSDRNNACQFAATESSEATATAIVNNSNDPFSFSSYNFGGLFSSNGEAQGFANLDLSDFVHFEQE